MKEYIVGTKVYSTEHIRRSASGLLGCRLKQQLSRMRNIRDVFAYPLYLYVKAICSHDDSSKHPYIVNCQPPTFFEIAGFVFLYRFSGLIGRYSIRLRHGGRTVAYHPAGVLKSIGAFARFLACICSYRFDVLHKKCSDPGPQTTSIDSTTRNQHHRQVQTCLVLKECVSWKKDIHSGLGVN